DRDPVIGPKALALSPGRAPGPHRVDNEVIVFQNGRTGILGDPMSLSRIVLAAMLAGGAVTPAKAAVIDLQEWRALTAEEARAMAGGEPASKEARPAPPFAIEADFDGDGVKDRAEILVRRSDQARALVATVRGKTYLLTISNPPPFEENLHLLDLKDGVNLQTAKPGRWSPNCFDDCDSRRTKPTRLKNPGIILGADTITLLFYWDAKTRRFSLLLMVH
ncbi:MAG TPA: hypothetical protein VHG30_13445, partial [Microvirga sp.]|nr:hypothetical protein [Microvirga sp.]